MFELFDKSFFVFPLISILGISFLTAVAFGEFEFKHPAIKRISQVLLILSFAVFFVVFCFQFNEGEAELQKDYSRYLQEKANGATYSSYFEYKEAGGRGIYKEK